SRRTAIASASGFSSMTEFTVGPEKSIRSIRFMYARVSRRDVVLPECIAAWSSAIVASFHRKESRLDVAASAWGAPVMPSVEAADAAAPAAAEYFRKLRRSMPSDEPSRRSPIALSLRTGSSARLELERGVKPAGDWRRTDSGAGWTAPRPDPTSRHG